MTRVCLIRAAGHHQRGQILTLSQEDADQLIREGIACLMPEAPRSRGAHASPVDRQKRHYVKKG